MGDVLEGGSFIYCFVLWTDDCIGAHFIFSHRVFDCPTCSTFILLFCSHMGTVFLRAMRHVNPTFYYFHVAVAASVFPHRYAPLLSCGWLRQQFKMNYEVHSLQITWFSKPSWCWINKLQQSNDDNGLFHADNGHSETKMRQATTITSSGTPTVATAHSLQITWFSKPS